MPHTNHDGSIRAPGAPPVRSRWLSLLGVLALTGCPSDELPQDLGECPDGSDVSWLDVQPVFAGNCTRCHSSERVTPGERSNATAGFDYDSPAAARSSAWLVWSQISSGRMPKDADFTAQEDALLVWEWLSCDGPE